MKGKNISQSIAGAALMLLLNRPLTSPAAADIRDDILDSAKRCNTIADDQRWLDCYYGVAQPMRARLGLVPAPQAQQHLLPPPRANTGLIANILGEARVADIHANLVSYSFNGSGQFTVTLSNGQIWEQSSSDTNQAKWSRPASSMSVTISPGAFATFNLFANGEGRAYKVKRLR
jgi:hypothetical protein